MPASDMNLTKPTVGGSSNSWGTTLNNNLDAIGEHDHTSGKGVKVPSAGININAALDHMGKRPAAAVSAGSSPSVLGLRPTRSTGAA